MTWHPLICSVPRRAPDVTVTTAGATALLVEWSELTPSEACGIITFYQVWYHRRDNREDAMQASVKAGSERQYVITGKAQLLSPIITHTRAVPQ